MVSAYPDTKDAKPADACGGMGEIVFRGGITKSTLDLGRGSQGQKRTRLALPESPADLPGAA